MANADDIRAMAQDMTASFDVRMGELAAIRQQVLDMLGDFRKTSADRKSEVSDMLGDFRKTRLHDAKEYRADRRREVTDLLGGFTKEREETASAWHDLVASMQAKRAHTYKGTKEFSSGEEPAAYKKAKKRKKG